MNGPMAKTPSQHQEAVADQQSATSMQKTSSILAPERKAAETALMMQTTQTW
jgi:hypothetical protein